MGKILIYDSDCPLCRWIGRAIGRLRIADASHRQPFQAQVGELANRMETAGVRNEMLVYDSGSGELRSGVEGFLWLLRDSRWRSVASVLGIAPIRFVLQRVYRTVAYNRRMLAPPPAGVVCACDPDPHRGYRWLFWLSIGAFQLAAAALFGYASGAAFESVRAMPAALIAVLTWPAIVLAARVASPLPAAELAGHTAMAISSAALAAMPLLVASLLAPGPGDGLLVALAVGVGVVRVFRGLRRRIRR